MVQATGGGKADEGQGVGGGDWPNCFRVSKLLKSYLGPPKRGCFRLG